ncbi:DgyrCDS14098 [Dimorphilus gyrociliatus]|uniref:DgyrCDS14098 n=1 Tax=Dimorphilus gyrociliatus TaxID=2664684 RepID=A0A7I8WCL5_9ANNE|nr:DgyrCDS14098 [Dimorphilus gyrociliatus]
MADSGESSKQTYSIIREIYENGAASEHFEVKLEEALEKAVSVIIIEPSVLGAETAKWIMIGNFLHKTSVLTGVFSLSLAIPNYVPKAYVPLGFVSFVCAGLYMASWQYDPCCKYQVEKDSRKLQKLPLHHLTSNAPVVLVRKDDSRRKILHTTIAIAAVSFSAYYLYNIYIDGQ